MAKIVRDYKENCGCRRCGTWAHISEFACNCVKVTVYNDRDPCDECTNFSRRREFCGQSGDPRNHQ